MSFFGQSVNLMDSMTSDEHEATFNEVRDPEDFRGPIRVILAADKVARAVASILFYTATCDEPIDNGDGTFIVTSDGYRMGPAGP